MMVGHSVSLSVSKEPAQERDVRLEITGLSVASPGGVVVVDDLDLSVRGGEIVCVAGVQGNGQSDLADAVPPETDREVLGPMMAGVPADDAARLAGGASARDAAVNSATRTDAEESIRRPSPPGSFGWTDLATTAGAFVLAFVVGGLLMIVSDTEVRSTSRWPR